MAFMAEPKEQKAGANNNESKDSTVNIDVAI